VSERRNGDVGTAEPGGPALGFVDIAERSRRLLVNWLSKHDYPGPFAHLPDPWDISTAFLELTSRLATSPETLVRAQVSLWHDYVNLWQNTTARMLGLPGEPVISADVTDGRFTDAAWEDNDIFFFIKQSYLLASRWLMRMVRDVDGLDPRTRQKVDSYSRQFVSALSPSNFALTNPEVIRVTIESRGENLVNGLKHLLDDLDWGVALIGGGNRSAALRPGETIASAPGKVIHRNEMMELIQYAPATDRVRRRPLLFVPPWINKYYLFDLRPSNSFVRWAVGQGHTVFMISWVNPDAQGDRASFEEYMLRGPIEALRVIADATGEATVNAVGYCLGGTLLAATLAFMAARGEHGIGSASYLATMLDFSEPGELGAFIDDATFSYLKDGTSPQDGEKAEPEACAREMAVVYTMLREHDLVWSYVVNTYLLGRDPFPFDLLHWNADTTIMPFALHAYYLRNFCRRNRLVEPGAIKIAGLPLDLGKVTVPSYFLSAREDHITPWKSSYKGARVFGGETRFTLAPSGHVTGIIDPPNGDQRCYLENAMTPANPDEWLAGARMEKGSWWPHWDAWVRSVSGDEWVAARTPGGGRVQELTDAPGRYVRARVA
jgi:polyhydroxyalkanoate synthase